MKRNVFWTGLGSLVVGGFLLYVGIVDDAPIRALLWIAGPIFIGLGVFAFYLLWRTRDIEEPQ